MMILFAKALGIGLLLAAPLGPIGLLCLRRSLTLGTGAGMAVGLGAATADAAYAAIAVFALAAAAPFIAGVAWLKPIGGAVLIVIGIKDAMQGSASVAPPTLRGQLGVYAGAVILTLTNPATILTFAAIIVGLDLVPDTASPNEGLIFVGGVFLGSTGWWVVLSTVGGMLGGRLRPGVLQWTRRVVGIIFIAFGIYALLS